MNYEFFLDKNYPISFLGSQIRTNFAFKILVEIVKNPLRGSGASVVVSHLVN